jgi:hypothetical protein
MYELEQLHGLVERLLQIRKHDDAHGDRDLDHLDMATRNAQVESFAIHVRSLIDFLYDVKRFDTDAIASDFVPDGWSPPEKPASLDPVKSRVGQEIAHLSYTRIGLNEINRQWPYLQIWNDLGIPLRAFARSASPDLLPTTMANRILGLTEPSGQKEFAFVFPTDSVMELALSATNPMPERDVIEGPGTATYRPSPPIPTDGS